MTNPIGVSTEARVFDLVQKEKVCSRCRVSKPHFEFYRRCQNKDGLRGQCKSCVIADYKANRPGHVLNPELASQRRKKWFEKIKKDPKRYVKHLEKKTKWNRSEKYFNSYFQRKFGISLSNFNALLSKQDGLCANVGCGRDIALTPSTDKAKAVVDHSHKTGQVRALLCVRCNALLGHVENDRGIIRGLFDYINKHT